MSDAPESNVVSVEFSASPYVAIGNMRDEIYSVIMAHASTVPLAAVLGVLRIIESELLEQHQ